MDKCCKLPNFINGPYRTNKMIVIFILKISFYRFGWADEKVLYIHAYFVIIFFIYDFYDYLYVKTPVFQKLKLCTR